MPQEEDANVKRAFQTLLTYIGNVVRAPDEEKFRKIRLTNPSFQVHHCPELIASLQQSSSHLPHLWFLCLSFIFSSFTGWPGVFGNHFVLCFYDQIAGNRSELGGSKVENISWSSVDLRRMQGVSFSLSHERKWITFCYKQRAKNLIQQLSIPSLAYYRISQYLASVILLLRVQFVHQKSHFCTVVTWVNLVVVSYRLHTMASSVLQICLCHNMCQRHTPSSMNLWQGL